MKKRIGVQGALILLAVWVIILLPRLAFPQYENKFLDSLLDIAGILLILFGFLFRISARGYKARECDSGKILIKAGPYSLIRNPMYFGTLMICGGVIFVLFKLWVLPLFLAFYLSIYIPQIRKEEEVLSARFGDEYREYCAKIPRYFPDFLRLIKPREYIILEPAWIKKEIVSLVITILAVFIIEGWTNARLFGAKAASLELIGLFLVVLCFFITVHIIFTKGEGHGQKKNNNT